MDPDTSSRLVEINRTFYQSFAGPFAATRQRLQPGVLRILSDLPLKINLLDLGCGNGEFVQGLVKRQIQGAYLGIDFSQALIETARGALTDPPGQLRVDFKQSDLTQPAWVNPSLGQKFDQITAFALLHHIPGANNRSNLLQQIARLLAPDGGVFILSNWQFLNSLRLKSRIQSWELAGINPMSVDEGDYLLDWRSGGQGLRYLHHFGEEELTRLARQAGFKITQSFYSDGKEGNLSLYQVWEL